MSNLSASLGIFGSKDASFIIYAADMEAMFMDPRGHRSRLPIQFAPSCPGGPPEKAGVYAVCACHWQEPFREHLLYIGSARNIRKRVMNPNHVYRRLYDRANGWLIYTRSFVTDNYLEWEKLAISELHPILNIQHKRRNG